jgi:uncharacterized membrane-anchored protein
MMQGRTSSQRKNENTQKANTYCVAALLALSFALLVLSVGTFLLSPVSVVGIISTCAGVAATLLCMLFFALYHHYLQQAEKDQ